MDSGVKKLELKHSLSVRDDACDEVSVEQLDERMRGLVRLELERNRLLGLPVAGYDETSKVAYLEFSGGRRDVVT